MAEIVGRARAKLQGYYPDDGVHCRLIAEGEVFNLVKGREKGSWFTKLDDPAPVKPGKGKADKPPAGDEIA